MIRSLYTGATGMNAQQMNIDNISHNLSNVNTTGFKKSQIQFRIYCIKLSMKPVHLLQV